MFILDILNKIKWDKRENPKDYTIFYYDRVEGALKEAKFENIKEIDNLFIILEDEEGEIHIPLHRIKLIKKKQEIVWKRD